VSSEADIIEEREREELGGKKNKKRIERRREIYEGIKESVFTLRAMADDDEKETRCTWKRDDQEKNVDRLPTGNGWFYICSLVIIWMSGKWAKCASMW
jgi:hypothetical protein